MGIAVPTRWPWQVLSLGLGESREKGVIRPKGDHGSLFYPKGVLHGVLKVLLVSALW